MFNEAWYRIQHGFIITLFHETTGQRKNYKKTGRVIKKYRH